LASGSLAIVIWYLIERACFSATSADTWAGVVDFLARLPRGGERAAALDRPGRADAHRRALDQSHGQRSRPRDRQADLLA
jgi:hypothetical protein